MAPSRGNVTSNQIAATKRDHAKGERTMKSVATVSIALGLLGALSAAPGLAQAPAASTKHIAARVELYPIQSVTQSDSQFLAGSKEGRPATVAGELRLAQGPVAKQPVVVLMHGSSGVGSNIEPWVHMFNEMGIATFVIDGFTGRGIVSTSTDQATLGRLNLIRDIYAGLDILAKHPRVDKDRIVLMGFSRGGQAALYASLDRFHKLWNTSGVRFAAYMPFYPDCSTSYEGDTDIAAGPVRIFHGAPDDYNPVASCKAFLTRLKAAGRDVTITEYANAPHGFDSPLSTTPVVAKGSQTVRACQIVEKGPGNLVNVATNAPFSYADACVQRDPTVGGNAEALAAVRKDVRAVIADLFKLTQ